MHIYSPIKLNELESLIAGSAWKPDQIFSATPEFLAEHPDLDDEECEYLLSLDAAQVALSGAERALVLAIDSDNPELLNFSDIQCIYLCKQSSNEDEIDLAWFGPTEIATQIIEWKKL